MAGAPCYLDGMAEKNPAVQNHNFNLKNVAVELIPESTPAQRADLSVEELEAMRVSRPAVPASKNGLEVICGASCEIGAH
jgi:hypothetical protein